MRFNRFWHHCFLISILSLLMGGCATTTSTNMASNDDDLPYSDSFNQDRYINRLPEHVDTGNEKTIIVNPREYTWGAYNADGELVRGGIAGAGGDYCPDDGGPCRTKVGTFRIYSLGDGFCRSRTYPRPKGGSLMPYCMFFNGGQSLHGSPDRMLVGQNRSHGCVNIRIPDAEWIRYNFANKGTKIIILPY